MANADNDICVFACTGKTGTVVCRRIVELSKSPLTLLLAGRRVAAVRALRTRLLAETNNTNVNNVTIVAYSQAVDVDVEDSIQMMVARSRVVVNCIDVDCHPRALQGVAEACARSGAHYVDLAPRCHQIQSLFSIRVSDHLDSVIIPASGFDYCFVDMAAYEAERAFRQRHATAPSNIQLTIAIRTGPLGIKWPLRLVQNHYLEKEHKNKPLPPSETSHNPPTQSTRGRFLAYIQPLSSWSIRWPLAADSMSFLLYQRQWKPDQVDMRMALPQKLWKAVFLVFYCLGVAAFILPLLVIARYLRSSLLQKLLMCILPMATLGFFSNDDALCKQAREEMRIELVVLLRDSRGQSLCYHVHAPSPEILNPLCLVLCSLELAQNKNDKRGVLTPAMAMGGTDFWSDLQKVCDVKVRITESIS